MFTLCLGKKVTLRATNKKTFLIKILYIPYLGKQVYDIYKIAQKWSAIIVIYLGMLIPKECAQPLT